MKTRKPKKPTDGVTNSVMTEFVTPSLGRKPFFVFFGTGDIATAVLDELRAAKLVPTFIVTAPDRPAGRGKILTSPPVKVWANTHNVPTFQPHKLDAGFCRQLSTANCQLFIVADYGKILPKKLLDIPPHDVLNVHPSLLPRLRGASPIRAAILNDERVTGVTVMLMDEEMDHGPIIAQKKIELPEHAWPSRAHVLEETLAHEGGKLLVKILPLWIAGDSKSQPQNHDLATYSKKIKKEDGLLHLQDDPYKNLLKVRAYEGWPGTYAFFKRDNKKMRVRITDAHIDPNGSFTIDRVIPEGKKEMLYEDFLRGNQPTSQKKFRS